MLEKLKQEVCEANIALVKTGLVLLSWGNVSGFDCETKCVVIKPSGLSYDEIKPEDMVVVDLDGNVIEGDLNPSSDTPTHVEIYKSFNGVKAVVHTHSKWATAYAQANVDIPCLGTTHADHFYGDIPCTRRMSDEEINGEYEKETGRVIVEEFNKRKLNPLDIPAIVVANHGPFSWGESLKNAVENSVVMEYAAQMEYISKNLNSSTDMQQTLIDKHYLRKHGKNAYYGQKKL